MSTWLPREFDGDLTYEEALRFLLVIANASAPCCDVWARFAQRGMSASPSVGAFRGNLRFSRFVEKRRNTPAHHLFVVGEDGYVSLYPTLLERAHLHTFDGADYYTLAFDMGGLSVVFADAYNGR